MLRGLILACFVAFMVVWLVMSVAAMIAAFLPGLVMFILFAIVLVPTFLVLRSIVFVRDQKDPDRPPEWWQ